MRLLVQCCSFAHGLRNSYLEEVFSFDSPGSYMLGSLESSKSSNFLGGGLIQSSIKLQGVEGLLLEVDMPSITSCCFQFSMMFRIKSQAVYAYIDPGSKNR